MLPMMLLKNVLYIDACHNLERSSASITLRNHLERLSTITAYQSPFGHTINLSRIHTGIACRGSSYRVIAQMWVCVCVCTGNNEQFATPTALWQPHHDMMQPPDAKHRIIQLIWRHKMTYSYCRPVNEAEPLLGTGSRMQGKIFDIKKVNSNVITARGRRHSYSTEDW